MPNAAEIRVDAIGLKQFRSDLKKVGTEFPKELRQANLKAANVVVPEAKRRASQSRPNLAGGQARVGSRGVASIRAGASQTAATITGGRSSIAWFGGNEFGSTGAYRQFPAANSDGYILWPAAKAKRDEVIEVYERELMGLASIAFPS